MKQYKVVVVTDILVDGSVNTERLQMVLNGFTPQGWHLVDTLTNSSTGERGRDREELVLFLEREFINEAPRETEDEWKCSKCRCAVGEGQKACHNCGEALEW